VGEETRDVEGVFAGVTLVLKRSAGGTHSFGLLGWLELASSAAVIPDGVEAVGEGTVPGMAAE